MNTTKKGMKIIKICIAGVALSLLIIGIVSHTPLRHTIQLLPLLAVLLLAKKSWCKFAALIVLLFWFFIVSIIWLYLLGVSHVINGTFSLTEIVMTLAIGIFCVMGLIAFFYVKSNSKILANAAALIVFLLLQISMMWISLQEFISNS